MLITKIACDSDMLILIKVVKQVLWYTTIIIPIVLIVFVTFDLFKIVIASKEDEIKTARKLLVKRIICAILIFLLVPIVTIVFGVFSKAGIEDRTEYAAEWKDYWNWKTNCK